LFNFRDSFQGPTAVVYDPECLLSSETINRYDLFHIIEAYQVNWFDDRAEFLALCEGTDLRGDFYGRLLRHRDPPLSLDLHYRAQEPQEDFRRQWEGRPVALTGFKLRACEQGGDPIPISADVAEAITEIHLTALLIAPDMRGWAIRQLKNSSLYGRKLVIDFPDRRGVEYTAYVGKAAWLAYPELQFAFKIREKMKSEAIIL
jgi:CRISPR-associated endonuclease/helicase Cas3